ncbi:MAG: hypothetical protein GX099_05815 [Clostridiaceae bacterium]|jgi:hypothetical protein|nr:hypothetical protein [Clostridiaceae bacterium]
MSTRTFKSSILFVLKTTIIVLSVLELISFFVLSIARSREDIAVAVILIGVVSPLLSIFWAAFMPATIEVTEQDIRWVRFGRAFRVIPIANHQFQALFRTDYYQYTIPIEYRYLQVTFPVGQTQKFRFPFLSINTYNALMTEIYRVSGQNIAPAMSIGGPAEAGVASERKVSEDVVHEDGFPFGGFEFIFPKKNAIKSFRLIHGGKALLVIFIVLSLSMAVIVPIVTGVPSARMPGNILVASLIILLILSVFLVPIWFSYRFKVKKIPSNIRITDRMIQIDGEVFSLDQIRRIQMTSVGVCPTPGEIRYLYRRMKIIGINGSSVYIFGHIGTTGSAFHYNEYGDLYHVINNFLNQAGKYVEPLH